MARNENPVGEGSRGGRGVRRGREGGRYARYTEEQIEILEKVYAKNSNPNCYQRAEIMSEEPLLMGIDKKQLKVWFQNRRCREKQKKEYSELEAENKKLTKANKALRVENNSLQKKLTQLMYENEDLRNQVLHLTSNITTRDLSRKPEASTSQLSLTIADNNNGYCRVPLNLQNVHLQLSSCVDCLLSNFLSYSLLLLAEETKNEFLSKAIGTAVNWTPVRGLKLRGQGSVGTIFVSSTCIGVAARAHSKVPFEPIKASFI
ncbi:hypothetical protein BUALT_Bualt01G0121100 [Buddleja alternifolia]|uniref:Homeobox domain-containing protein n=1 Tax=Buddleja alternifolia TaxID=168488 RepID=A0AAV6YDF9_9LAMI|nr:hypothetical protein BUALT_Bualt01G0121100 [Buddleja alternifolia]